MSATSPRIGSPDPETRPGMRPRPMSNASLRSPPLSPAIDDKVEHAFDPFFGVGRRTSRVQKGTSVAINEVPENTVDETPEKDDSRPAPLEHRQSSYVEFPAKPAELSPFPDHVYYIVVDVLVTAAPLLLIVYGIFAAILHNRPTSSNFFTHNYSWSGMVYGPAMMEAQILAPTLFPMIFGLELVALIKAFAVYRAERGTRIGFIEQLIGSQSLGGTFKALLGLRIINWIGLGLLAMWCLAPIGSQAGARLISKNGTLYQTDIISYMSTNATPTGLEAGFDDLHYYKYAVDSMYATTILTPSAMQSPQDVWANVKIPSLEWLQANNGCDTDGWCSFDLAKSRAPNADLKVTAGTFSSLTGLPVVGSIYGMGVQNFTFESSYYAFNCPTIHSIDASTVLSSALPNRSANYNTENGSLAWDSGVPASPFTFLLDTTTPVAGMGNAAGNARPNATTLAPREITFASRSPNGTTYAQCNVSLSHVQTDVLCNFTSPLWTTSLDPSGRSAAGACYARRIRRSQVDNRPVNYTPLDDDWRIPQRFFDAWPGATGQNPMGSSSPTERFIYNVASNSANSEVASPIVAANWLGFTTVGSSDSATGYVQLATLDPETFTERFALLFNTYWHSFCNLQALTETEIGLGFAEVMPANVMFNNASLTMALPGQFYEVNFGWLAVFFVCTLIATLAGCLAMLLKYNTLLPDVLGSISTLTRDNPNTPIPSGGSTLDGVEFARHVMHMPVRFVDTRPDEPIGHIALSTVEDEEGQENRRRLRRGRFYA